MSNQIDNIKEQVGRLEDLLKLYISQEKEQIEQHKEFAMDKIDMMKRIQDQTLGGFVVVITILLGLTQLPFLKTGDSNSNLILYALIYLMIVLLVLGFIAFIFYNHWRQKTAWTLGELLRYYDKGIDNFETILEYSIIGTANNFEGEKVVVLTTIDAMSILKLANQLYQIKSHEKISKLSILPDFRREYHRKQADTLKANATFFYEEYVKLDRSKISYAMRKVICNVFYDNEEYIKLNNHT